MEVAEIESNFVANAGVDGVEANDKVADGVDNIGGPKQDVLPVPAAQSLALRVRLLMTNCHKASFINH